MTDPAITAMYASMNVYLNMREERGIPLRNATPGAELPAFVRRAGQGTINREWAPIRRREELTTTVQAPIEKPATVTTPTPPKRVQGEQGIGRAGTTAEQVRAMIREAMRNNLTVEVVIERCKTELGFADSKAKRYATENWERVKKADRK